VANNLELTAQMPFIVRQFAAIRAGGKCTLKGTTWYAFIVLHLIRLIALTLYSAPQPVGIGGGKKTGHL
jgi:hypothetical protein